MSDSDYSKVPLILIENNVMYILYFHIPIIFLEITANSKTMQFLILLLQKMNPLSKSTSTATMWALNFLFLWFVTGFP